MLKDIKVIVTAAGCPGASTFIRYLREKVTERNVEVIAIDMNIESIGRFIADKFVQVPPANDEDYIPAIKSLIKQEKLDVFFCVSSFEVPVVAAAKSELEELGTKIIVAAEEAAEIGGNKYKLYKALENVEDVNIPNFILVKTLDEFVNAAYELGYPDKRICFKPPFSKGSRGYRVIDDSISRLDLLLKHKPDSTFISMNELKSIFKEENIFPELLVMEYVEGEEIDAMTLAMNGEMLLVTCKTRETTRAGVIMTGELVKRPKIEKACSQILKKIPIDFNAGMQFKGGYLIEINTRVSTFIYQDDLIEPYLSIKLALNEITPAEVKEYQRRVDYGRRMLRYMDQIFY